MFRPISFKKFITGYAREYRRELEEYWTKNKNKGIIPLGLDDEILHQYTAYQNYLQSGKLIMVTWVLAIATIIFSGLTLYFQYHVK